MNEMQLGPNGALMYAMEYLVSDDILSFPSSRPPPLPLTSPPNPTPTPFRRSRTWSG
jgi:hypothetical protein